MKNKNHIIVVDQTIREGTQHRGMVFSIDERSEILKFQEALGVDISQAAYPSAHESERKILKTLASEAVKKGYKIRLAGLGRAIPEDVEAIASTGVSDIHLHVSPPSRPADRSLPPKSLTKAIARARSLCPDSSIGVSILDIGKTAQDLVRAWAEVLVHELSVDILTLPDTSGILAPNILFDKIRPAAEIAMGTSTVIGVHCHNDMGMATANTVMGCASGASVIEATAWGIGERNGIGDIFLVGKTLKNQGYNLNLKTHETEVFKNYYEFIDKLYEKKTGGRLINYNTPFFGRSMGTHVAGTHAMASFGLKNDEEYFLNVLCGKRLLKKYLLAHKIPLEETSLIEILARIKDLSARFCRSVSEKEVIEIITAINNKQKHKNSRLMKS